jgi:hypothetical protein
MFVDLSPQAGRGEEACASRAVVVGVRIEQLLAIDLVVGDRLLPFRRHQPVDELLAELLLHVRILGRHTLQVESPDEVAYGIPTFMRGGLPN